LINKTVGLGIVSTDIRGDEATTSGTATSIESFTTDTQEEEEEEVAGEIEGMAKLEEGNQDGPIGDIPSATLSDPYRMMDTIYGDHVHQNDCINLNGGIVNDATWEDY
jgi:hypothetical protein